MYVHLNASIIIPFIQSVVKKYPTQVKAIAAAALGIFVASLSIFLGHRFLYKATTTSPDLNPTKTTEVFKGRINPPPSPGKKKRHSLDREQPPATLPLCRRNTRNPREIPTALEVFNTQLVKGSSSDSQI